VKYNFPHVIGHENVKRQIVETMEKAKLPHAYLIQGGGGSGLFALALDISMLLLCTEEERPCLMCSSCKKILNNAHQDFQVYHPFPSMQSLKIKEEQYWETMQRSISSLIQNPYEQLSFETEEHLFISTMRQLRKNMKAGKNDETWRVTIICDADRMEEEAATSVLKALEEPLPNTLFLLLTSHPYRLLPTVISRCQSLLLGQFTDQEVSSYLCKHFSKDDISEKLELAAKLANGSIPRAVEFLEGRLDEAYRYAQKLIGIAEAGNIEEALNLAEEITKTGDKGMIRKMFEIVLIMVRDACILDSKGPFPFEFNLKLERTEQYLRQVKLIITDMESNVTMNILLFTRLRALQKGEV